MDIGIFQYLEKFRNIKYCEVWPRCGGSKMVLGVDGEKSGQGGNELL